ncbi:RNA methyltransferase [Halobacteriovorax vibrionivorans]|uniref:RNA methyltransferase n=1 Tax=Halobacteriovorax vibrionivorans TaxID=2152716 RepID=A0ABY0IPI4_9BACT|nr:MULTISPECIES: RNA methyltransferase [Halobacteriovorax]RZF23092.1 RNA methyltransferase [Halobacteriovorax vibrionivorans]TGD49276.1 RNA methyltransferase [Halobacteriovorax sp. Y22]
MIDEFYNLKDKNLIKDNYCIAETEKVVCKALRSKHKVEKIIATKEFYDRNKELIDDKCDQVFIRTKEELQNITGIKLHHGILAKVRTTGLQNIKELGDRIIIFNGVTSPENVGTMTRAAMAFGFDSIIYDAKSASPYLRRCIRVSMGNAFEARVAKSLNLVNDISLLQELGYTVIATANEEGAISIQDFKYPQKTCLIIGNEGNGMDREVIDACDKKLFIPITNYVAHLNAASAASIFLYHSIF